MKLKINKSKIDKSSLPSMKKQSNVSIMVLVTIVMMVLIGVIYFSLTNILKTETYYVLKNNVPAKVQVTSDMLEPIEVSLGGAPKNAISKSQVDTGSIFTKYPVSSGDILTASNTGVSLDTTTGIPDDWSITSFNIISDNAVGGNVQRGDYFDIIGVSKDTGAKYIATNLLALEVSSDTQATEEVTETGKSSTSINETLQYVVGMPPNAVAQFHHALTQYDEIKLVKSPNVVAYAERSGYNLNDVYTFGNVNQVIDLLKGTDRNFSPILRDNSGRPVTVEACKEGIIKPEELCKGVADKEAKETINEEETTKETESTKPAETKVETKEETPKPSVETKTEAPEPAETKVETKEEMPKPAETKIETPKPAETKQETPKPASSPKPATTQPTKTN